MLLVELGDLLLLLLDEVSESLYFRLPLLILLLREFPLLDLAFVVIQHEFLVLFSLVFKAVDLRL